MTVATVTKQGPRTESSGLTGRHVLWSLIAFFGLIFAVNGYFLYAAISTYSGVVANEPYRKGLEYNQRIAADARQHELGWTESLDIAATRDTLMLDLKDKNGLPGSASRASGRSRPPVDQQAGRHRRLGRDCARPLHRDHPEARRW